MIEHVANPTLHEVGFALYHAQFSNMRAKRLGRIRIDDGKLCNQGRGRRENAVGPYAFDDALTGSSITCDYPGLQALMVERSDEPSTCASLFFPGCSLINYGLPLVQSVYDLLKSAGEVDGISLLCCGKILQYEPDGPAQRRSF